MERSRQDFLLGLVFFAGLGLLLAGTIWLTADLFGTTQTRTVYFEDAAGLSEGDSVFVLGHRLGQVKQVEFVPAGDPRAVVRIVDGVPHPYPIAVTLRLRAVIPLRAGYRITIQDGNLLGGKQIGIDPGPSTRPEAVGTLFGEAQPGGIEALRDALELVTHGEGSLSKLINESALYDEIVASARSLRMSLERVEGGPGVLHRIIYSPQLEAEIADVVRRAKNIVVKVDEGVGFLGTVINEGKEVWDKVDRITDDIEFATHRIARGEGTIGRLIADPDTTAKFDRIASNLDEFAGDLNNEDSLLHAITNDSDLKNDVAKLFDNLESMTSEIRNGNGLLARVIYDEELGEELARVMRQVSRAIEDAREAAPVGTFFQVFSASF